MNNCVFVGRLTDDPEIRYANNEAQTAVAKMCIAVDRPVRKGEEKKADFFRCICFGQRAEFAANYLRKGKRIAVQGRMQNESFEGKDGNTVRYTELLANEINFADGKDEPAEESARTDGNATGGVKGSGAAAKQKESAKGAGKAAGKTAGGGAGRADSARAKQADERFMDMPDDEEELPFH